MRISINRKAHNMWYLAQTSLYSSSSTTSSSMSPAALIAIILLALVTLVALWKIFEKAGQPGWKAIIPIYNGVIYCRMAGLSGWFVILLFLPFVNFIVSIIVAYKLAKAFGYGIGMTILEIFYIGLLVLGFGKAEYVGPYHGSNSPSATQPASS